MEDLFRYKDDEFSAIHMDAAEVQFMDRAWGEELVKYLDARGLDSSFESIGVEDDSWEVSDYEYRRNRSTCSNGMKILWQIWANDDGTFMCDAQEIETGWRSKDELGLGS